MADRLEELIVRQSFDEPAQSFVEAADFFFLSTVDDGGFPTVSYKGGDPGFVKVPSATTLLFPCYDGNGMFFSMGNLDAHPQVGLLFIDFESPHRVRVQGKAELLRDPEVLSLWPETALAVQVEVTNVWFNCPRYVHRMQRTEPSPYVPREGVQTPQPDWKSSGPVAGVVPPEPHTLKTP
jgi:predicted pyridoxine 5'-phosphate oxidase superfamily flavin-nucleotide-binding protein